MGTLHIELEEKISWWTYDLGLTINTGEVHRQQVDFGVYAVQFEPPSNGPTNYIAQVDDAETTAKTPAQAGEQQQQRIHATTEVTEEPDRSEALPYPIQATSSCYDVSAVGHPVQAVDDSGIPSLEGAVGGLEFSVEVSDDFNNQDYANRQLRSLPPGVPLYHHTDVGLLFEQQFSEERETSTSEEETTDLENSWQRLEWNFQESFISQVLWWLHAFVQKEEK